MNYYRKIYFAQNIATKGASKFTRCEMKHVVNNGKSKFRIFKLS